VLQCVAVCCSVLQCVAVCCSVLQCVAVCCIVLQWNAVCCSELQCVAVNCSVWQCVAVFCSVLQCVAVLSAFVCYWATVMQICVFMCRYPSSLSLFFLSLSLSLSLSTVFESMRACLSMYCARASIFAPPLPKFKSSTLSLSRVRAYARAHNRPLCI